MTKKQPYHILVLAMSALNAIKMSEYTKELKYWGQMEVIPLYLSEVKKEKIRILSCWIQK